jgi:hypothetical protein
MKRWIISDIFADKIGKGKEAGEKEIYCHADGRRTTDAAGLGLER